MSRSARRQKSPPRGVSVEQMFICQPVRDRRKIKLSAVALQSNAVSVSAVGLERIDDNNDDDGNNGGRVGKKKRKEVVEC